MYPYINVLGKTVPAYGLFLIVSSVAAWLMILLLARIKKQLKIGDVSLTFLIAISGCVIGVFILRPVMKLAEIAVSWEKYRALSPGELLNYIMTGEIVFYGGFLGGMAAVILFCRKFKIELIPFFDLAAPALAFAHAIGRIGCFLGGCCYGIEMPRNHPLSIVYPTESLGAPSGVSLLAAPIIESIFLLILAIVLTVICLKSSRNGICSSVYVLTYPIGRFILEFFRGDTIRGNYGLLTTSQFISIAIFIGGVFYFLSLNRREAGKEILSNGK